MAISISISNSNINFCVYIYICICINICAHTQQWLDSWRWQWRERGEIEREVHTKVCLPIEVPLSDPCRLPATDLTNLHPPSCYGQSGQMTLALQVANRMREVGFSSCMVLGCPKMDMFKFSNEWFGVSWRRASPGTRSPIWSSSRPSLPLVRRGDVSTCPFQNISMEIHGEQNSTRKATDFNKYWS